MEGKKFSNESLPRKKSKYEEHLFSDSVNFDTFDIEEHQDFGSVYKIVQGNKIVFIPQRIIEGATARQIHNYQNFGEAYGMPDDEYSENLKIFESIMEDLSNKDVKTYYEKFWKVFGEQNSKSIENYATSKWNSDEKRKLKVSLESAFELQINKILETLNMDNVSSEDTKRIEENLKKISSWALE